MGFKSKIKPNEVETLDFKTYTSMLKKEVVKAAKFGQIDFVHACSSSGETVSGIAMISTKIDLVRSLHRTHRAIRKPRSLG